MALLVLTIIKYCRRLTQATVITHIRSTNYVFRVNCRTVNQVRYSKRWRKSEEIQQVMIPTVNKISLQLCHAEETSKASIFKLHR